jgi:nitroimidazol reductase NimA-like FMN-containing flavoprotein (pyridoxamine 5'-phosphate oxidase superfamily)
MLIKEMTVKQCHEFLVRMDFGRLGCVHDNHPYVVPIYFAYEPDRLYGFSTLGRKIEWMRSNRSVCVEVDEVIGATWNCVIASGRYEELPNTSQYVADFDGLPRRAVRAVGDFFRCIDVTFQGFGCHDPRYTLRNCVSGRNDEVVYTYHLGD